MQGDYSIVTPEAENDKLISALGYIFWFIPIIVLVTDLKKSRFNKIHAYQGLVFVGAAFVYFMAFCVVNFIATSAVPLLACILWIPWFVPVVPAVYFAYLTFSKGQVEFPYLTQATRSVFKDI